MTALELIALVEDCGGRVLLREGGIKLTARKPLPGSLVARLNSAKPDIVSFLQRQEIVICGQCAVIVKEGQEYLNVVADGFPGVVHLNCYNAWYDGNIRGRYPD
jgi:hypothetical protein